MDKLKIVNYFALCVSMFIKIVSSQDKTAPMTCLRCSSVVNGQPNPICAPEEIAFEVTSTVPCDFGACFTTLEKRNGVSIGYRGCTNNLPEMPYTLPKEGCYNWRGITICICFDDQCNLLPPEKSSGKALDDHVKNPPSYAERGPIDCYQCMNKDTKGNEYKQCPRDSKVLGEKVYKGECNSTCFTRTFKDDPTRVARGCTDTQWGLPVPLPPDGCYKWDGGVWCVCNAKGCNGRPMGKSSNVNLDDHLYTDGADFEEPDGLNRCFECINYDDKGNYYKQCPKNDHVRNAYARVCNETCFTRSYDYDDKKIARGCTDTQFGLPDPLPPDGCYKYYSEIWCVCSTSRCNRNALGKPQDIEFDAHIPKDGDGEKGGALALNPSLISFLFSITTILLISLYKI